jgi:hypothetical protein
MAPFLMTINQYLSPSGRELAEAERFRLLEVAICAFDPATAGAPGSLLYWSLVAALQQAGYEVEAVREQAGILLQAYRYSEARPLTSALWMRPGGANLYTMGGAEAVLSLCVAALGGESFAPTTATQGQLALAIREMGSAPAELAREEVEQQLTIVGFLSLGL